MTSVSDSLIYRSSRPHGLDEFSLKRLVTWGEHLKVAQPQIDAQHQAIFDIAMEVADIWNKQGDVDRLTELTDKLGRVLKAHFQFEEQQLEEIGYTKLAEHRAEHEVMLGELQTILHRLEKMGHGSVKSQPGFLVLSFILGVTAGHITHSDMDYVAFARAAAGRNGQPWPAA